MAESPLKTRRQFLFDTQNLDGGWAYFPGKQSWLEPTVYAALALHGTPAALRAQSYLTSLALPEGGWRPTAAVQEPSWAMSLALTLCSVNGWDDPTVRRGISQLERTIGAEGSFVFQVTSRLRPELTDLDFSLQGWPWRPGTTSWIEPTAHAIIALRNIASFLDGKQIPNALGLERRIGVAGQMILARRAPDGGWNYGSRRAHGVPLPSFPETTALALIALRGNPNLNVSQSLEVAERHFHETRSELARAWLTIAFDLYGVKRPSVEVQSKASQDVLIAALQCLSAEGTGQRFFSPVAVAS